MEEDEESQSGGSQSSVSYDEASYDSRAGKIEYSCQDDEVIAAGAPGATMYDQDIRETSVAAKLVVLHAPRNNMYVISGWKYIPHLFKKMSGLYQRVDKNLTSKKPCQQYQN